MSDAVTFFSVQKHSLFIPLKFLYPECLVLIENTKNIPLQCMQSKCDVDSNCATRLAKRVKYIFDNVAPDAKMMYAYFRYKDRPGSIRAGVFDRELNEPKVIIMNQSGFAKFRKEGLVQQWYPPLDYWLLAGSDKLIPVEHLLVKK